jgi:hypothetical protein
MPIGEGQGFLIGDELVLYSGFSGNFSHVTRKTFALNLNNAVNGVWREFDKIPILVGLSHAAHALDSANGILYVCGGYLGKFFFRSTHLVCVCVFTFVPISVCT